MASFENNKPFKYYCSVCDTKTNNKKDYNNHILTRKHKKKANPQQTASNETQIPEQNSCKICKKVYESRSGLWRHKKTCVAPKPESIGGYIKEKDTMIELLINENKDFKNIILELVKNNGDLQKQMMEVCSKGSNSMVNSNNHSHNKTFNLQFFLNEQCKDAMNIMDFVNSMTLELSDLEDVGKLGYVEGISGIIIRKLNELDIYNRPIHCSDAKREIMYVKDDNIWEKENSTYDKLRKAIKQVTYKNSSLLMPWSQKYPACMNNQHHLNDVYIQLVGQAMGGKEEFVDSENKIMKKIAKAVLIAK
jgi:hypothetical protein